jgi:CRISPR system Cascade subunit CasB
MAQPKTTDLELQPGTDLARPLAHIAGIIASRSFPTGERAVLRRINPTQPTSIYFYRFALRHLPENWEHNAPDWQTLVAGMALMAPTVYLPGRRFGMALAEADYSEARLERLLAAEGDTQRTLLLRAIRFLATKAKAFDWLDAARLIFARGEMRERVQARIARDFYTILNHQSNHP